MALLSWFETMGASDCFSGHTTWNDMVDYIKHSACTDFTIHSTCTDTGQAFRFTRNPPYSKIYGSDVADDDLMISANDVNMRSRIILQGDGDIWFDSGDDIYFKENGLERFKFYNGKSIDFLDDRAIHIDDDETYIGHGAGDNIAAGTNNTLVGHDAGNAITNGSHNIAMGIEALFVTNIGNSNMAIGGTSLRSNISGNNNVAVGKSALYSNTNNHESTAVGYSALYSSTGEHNTGIGRGALALTAGGEHNTALGWKAGFSNVTGGYNVFLGYAAGYNELLSNKLYINNSTSAFPLIYGEFNNDIIKFGDNNTAWFAEFHDDHDNSSTWAGGSAANHRLDITATSAALYPAIALLSATGTFGFTIDGSIMDIWDANSAGVGGVGAINFLQLSVDHLNLDSVIYTASNDYDLYLKPHGSGLVKFGTYAAKGAEAFAGFITMKDSGGTSRKVMVCA